MVLINPTTERTDDDWIIEIWFDDGIFIARGVSNTVETAEAAIECAIRSDNSLHFNRNRIKEVKAFRRWQNDKYSLKSPRPVRVVTPKVWRTVR